MKALVTGGAGFIGSHLVELLMAEGYDVRAMAHYRGDGSIGFLAGLDVEVVRGDVCDAEAFTRHAQGCGLIFNLAALGNPAYSVANPRHVYEVNTGGALNALEAARATGAKLVQMSTSEAYGTALDDDPMDESHPLRPRSPYGASKAAADMLCLSYAASYPVDVTIARCFNVYGPRQSARAVIPAIMLQILRQPRGQPAKVRLAALDVWRDYTYVTDTCAALLALARQRGAGGPVNVAFGQTRSLHGLALECGEALMEIAGTETVVVEQDPAHERPYRSEVNRLLGEASLLRSLTDWRPTVSFRDGLRRVAEWVIANEATMPRGLQT